MSRVIIPGSFDPMTLGHRDLVEKALKRHDEVIVAVMINPSKRYLFDMQTRLEIAKLTVADLPNVSVVAEKGLLIDLFDRLDASAVCKGWRNAKDYDYEIRMADWNREHNPRFRTELIRSRGEFADLSSTEVRAALAEGRAPEGWVHPNALPLILTKMKGETT